MSLYILDTDCLTLLQHNHPKISLQVRNIDRSNLFITTVALEEQLRGRLAVISKAATKPEQLTVAYRNLRMTQFFFCNMNLLACKCYQNLLQQKIRIGTQDLRIAAIALANQATLVTRNQQDFSKIPNLLLEDWTVSTRIN